MSAKAIFDELGPVVTRWTIGGPATGDAPAEWKSLLQGDPAGEAELRLLALTGQFLELSVLPAARSPLRELPDLPVLPLPLLPDELRPLMRRCLKSLREAGFQLELIRLMAARGRVCHPADWMPLADDNDLPDVYAPWRDWVDAVKALGGATPSSDEEISEETWADYQPAGRCVALKRLRRLDPVKALDIMVAKAGAESADIRLRLIECLAVGLSAADIPYLQGLLVDRAPKIRGLANALLARLGQGGAESSEAGELAGFLERRATGLSRRGQTIVPRAIKTPAQRQRRRELFGSTAFADLARALGASVDDFAASWTFGVDSTADEEMMAMAARSAPDTAVDVLSMRLGGEAIEMRVGLQLRPRLGMDQRRRVATQMLRNGGCDFRAALLIAGSGAELEALTQTGAGKSLIAALTGGGDPSVEMQSLGLLASQDAAGTAIDELVAAGLMASDPRLGLLRLNAALANNGEQG